MKLEIQTGDRTYQVETVRLDDGAFRISWAASQEGSQEVEVRVLSRTRNRWTLLVDGRVHDVLVSGRGQGTLVDVGNRSWETSVSDRRRLLGGADGLTDDRVAILKAKMPGKVIQVFKGEGEPVETGDGLAVIEAMKMQNELKSPKKGVVIRCTIAPGETVAAGQTLFEIE